MTVNDDYEYSLSISSQFYFCNMPLRLDSYSNCLFNCAYCFSRIRGGNRRQKHINVTNPQLLARRFERLQKYGARSVVDEFLARKQPIHFGGLSDPFMPLEAQKKISLDVLKVLAEAQYPTVISTKSDLIITDEYLETIKAGKFIVQVSVSSLDETFIQCVDEGTPSSSDRFRALRILNAEGVPTTCRIQPIFPGRINDAKEVIHKCHECGVGHVTAEHLKLGFDNIKSSSRLSASLGYDVVKYYKENNAYKDGREWILSMDERIRTVKSIKSMCAHYDIRFGSADNDLRLFSDGACCCGTDFIDGFNKTFNFNFPEAVRRSINSNYISIDHIKDLWRPNRSISRYINSKSRLKDGKVRLEDYIRKNWNGSKNGASPLLISGVYHTGEIDNNGFKLYRLADKMKKQLLEYSNLKLAN